MRAAPQLDGRPEVIVDVDVRDGLFSILLRNIGPRPALPGLTTFNNVTLKRGLATSRELWQWHRTVVTGNVERRTCRIVVLAEALTPVARYRLENAWPKKYEGPRLEATGNDVALETLELAHEGLELE